LCSQENFQRHEKGKKAIENSARKLGAALQGGAGKILKRKKKRRKELPLVRVRLARGTLTNSKITFQEPTASTGKTSLEIHPEAKWRMQISRPRT
jgi:hypothetical protein